jgi:hypothetical protein
MRVILMANFENLKICLRAEQRSFCFRQTDGSLLFFAHDCRLKTQVCACDDFLRKSPERGSVTMKTKTKKEASFFILYTGAQI